MEPSIERRFWGLQLSGYSATELDLKSSEVHISNAALRTKTSKDTIVSLSMGDNEYTLCTLSSANPQANLDLTIYPSPEDICFLSQGPGDIDLTGIITIDMNDNDEEIDDENEEEIDDDNEEEMSDNDEEIDDVDDEDADDAINSMIHDEDDDDDIDDDIDDVDDFNDIDSDEIPKSSVTVEEITSEDEKMSSETGFIKASELVEKKKQSENGISDKTKAEEVKEITKPVKKILTEEEKKEKKQQAKERKREEKKKKEAQRKEFPVRMLNKNTTYKDQVIGSGKLPVFGHKVTITYSSTQATGEPAETEKTITYRTGLQEINDCLDKAVQGMREGGQRKVIIHPEALKDVFEQNPSFPKESKYIYIVKLEKAL